MTISVVNGYVCLTSCDAAAARHGKDPAAPPGSTPGTHDEKASAFDTQPATALKDFTRPQAANSGVTSPVDARQTVNILA